MGLLLWALTLSPSVLNPEKVQHLTERWENIWAGEQEWRSPWMARVPLSHPTGKAGVGNDAIIYGFGCADGYFEVPAASRPALGKLPLEFFEVHKNVGVTVSGDVGSELSRRTKARLQAWLKRAYAGRYRLPTNVLGLEYSWEELEGLPRQRVREEREKYAEDDSQRLGEPISNRRKAFDETLKQTRKRRGKRRVEALRKGVQFQFLKRGPGRRVYMKGDRISTFFHCFVQTGDRMVVYDADVDWTGVDTEASIRAAQSR